MESIWILITILLTSVTWFFIATAKVNLVRADRDRWKGACEQNMAYCAQFAEEKDRYRRMLHEQHADANKWLREASRHRRMAEWLARECSQQSWLMRERGFKIGVAVSGTMRGCATKEEWLQAAADAVTGEGDG